MDQTVKAQWLEALRSGRYEQGKYDLRRNNEFCCLGVLCDLLDPGAWDPYNDAFLHHGSRTLPNLDLLERIGLTEDVRYELDPPAEDEDPPNPDDNYAIARLVIMNDQENKSFEEIADFIEAKL